MKWVFGMLVLLCLAACHAGRHAASPKESDPAPALGSANPTEKPATSEDMEGKLTEMGPVTVVGILQHTKGKLGSLGKYILPGDFLAMEKSMNWKPEFEAMVGKKVEAKGVHFRYRCSPIEQCLEGGVIDYLNQLEYLRLAE